jgi:hypothetical protein
MTAFYWLINLIFAGYPIAAKVWAKELINPSLQESDKDSHEDSPDDIRAILSSTQEPSHGKDHHHHDDIFQGIQPAYTIGIGPDGGALILLFKQRTKGTKTDHARDAYLQDRLYYNKLGQMYCEKMNIKYRGSDSGLYQNHTTFSEIMSVFSQDVREKIASVLNFTTGFHFTGTPELEARAKGRFLRRKAYDVGNGQGLQYHNPNRSPNHTWPFPLWDVPLTHPVDQKNVITPDDIIWIPSTANEHPSAPVTDAQ